MTEIATVDAEVVLSEREARSIDIELRSLAVAVAKLTDQIKEKVAEAKAGNVHEALGFSSWTAYISDVMGGVGRSIARADRPELVGLLAGEGLSTRAIAEVVGVGVGTVHRDLSGVPNGTPEAVTGLDGKTYRPRREVVITDPMTGEESGRIVDDRDPADISDDEYTDMLLDEDREQWEAEQHNVIECTDCAQDHDPAVITELDTETLLCPPCLDKATGEEPEPAPAEPAKPRRRPITESFDAATFELKRAIERVVRLAGDDRLGKNKDQIKASNLSDLVRVRDAINGVINTLEG